MLQVEQTQAESCPDCLGFVLVDITGLSDATASTSEEEETPEPKIFNN